ncbi:MAG: hypothetical protein ABI655_16380 [Phenylobacterium sp.]
MKAAAALAVLALAMPTAVGADATALGIGYICGAEQEAPGKPPAELPMLPGMGNGGYAADTANRQAQGWFDYGINTYHAFNHRESKGAFAKAAALDPDCALCAWGVALSLGPTLNYGISPAETAAALAAADHAAKLARPDDARTQGLIAALQLRYGATAPAGGREQAYGRAMDALARRYPADDQIAELAAHALLTPARQDDFSGVARAEDLMKAVLARKPDDTAAIHYYIHATEFAGHAGLALPYAERLADLAPGAGHLVHMAAHTLMHVGQYEQVAVVDARALKVDADVKAAMGYTGPLSAQMYYLHNFTFGLAGALMAGDRQMALKYADHAAIAFPAAALPDRRNTATARSYVALGRYAPDRALALPDDAGAAPALQVYRHYARGEAFAARGDVAGVRREAEALSVLETGLAPTRDTAAIAGGVLAGRAALLDHRPADAVAAFAKAAARQEKAFPVDRNFDPPPWWYPVRRSLAAAYLQMGDPAAAAREARASLVDWPKDALALRVLGTAEAELGQTGASRDHLAQARRAWRGDLAKLPMTLT